MLRMILAGKWARGRLTQGNMNNRGGFKDQRALSMKLLKKRKGFQRRRNAVASKTVFLKIFRTGEKKKCVGINYFFFLLFFLFFFSFFS